MTHFVSSLVTSAILFSAISQASIPPQDNTVFKDMKRGITITSNMPHWSFSLPSADKEDLLFIARGPKSSQEETAPTLTLRTDSSQEYKTAKAYSDHWLKEYPKYGFQVEYARPNTFVSKQGYELQVKSIDAPKMVYQVVLPKGSEMLIFTCTSETKGFKNALEACKKIISGVRLTL